MSIANELSHEVVASITSYEGVERAKLLRVAQLLHSTLRALSVEEKRRVRQSSFHTPALKPLIDSSER